ncbi:MAG: hypothetical protein AAGF01_29050, partial [Cyanobacteria bacterium P01_G01_bin.38]
MSTIQMTRLQESRKGLICNHAKAKRLFHRITNEDMSGSQPYLTQWVCQKVLSQDRSDWSENAITQLIHDLFFKEKPEGDKNLTLVHKTLTERPADADKLAVLETYRQIWRNRHPVYDEAQSIVKAHLKLSGAIKRDRTKSLQVRNKIYRTVFDDRWVKDHLPFNWRKRLRRLQAVIASGLVVMVSSTGLTGWALWQRYRANSAWSELTESVEEVSVLTKQALIQAQDLKNKSRELEDKNKELTQALEERDTEKTRAEEGQAAAEESEQAANEQRLNAETARQNAEAARQNADELRLRAEAGEADALQQRQSALESQAIAELQADIA